jgi:hypothetical protein
MILYSASAWLAADFAAGVFHWIEERYGDPSWPIVGKLVIEPNILHHTDQMRFTHGSYWTRNWTTIMPSMAVAAVAACLGLYWLSLVFVIVSQANEIHCWSHQKCNRFIRGLQLLGVLQSPEQHKTHHRIPFDTSFCTMTDILNPVLNSIGFWRYAEAVVGIFGTRPRPERESA